MAQLDASDARRAEILRMYPEGIVSGWQFKSTTPCTVNLMLGDPRVSDCYLDTRFDLSAGETRRVFIVANVYEQPDNAISIVSAYVTEGARLLELATDQVHGDGNPSKLAPVLAGWHEANGHFTTLGYGRIYPLFVLSWGPFASESFVLEHLFGWTLTGIFGNDETSTYCDRPLAQWEKPVWMLTVCCLPRH